MERPSGALTYLLHRSPPMDDFIFGLAVGGCIGAFFILVIAFKMVRQHLEKHQ